MEERLYLFEVLIDSIYFDESVTDIPLKKQIVVTVKLGNIVTLEIRSESLPVGGEGRHKRLIDFKSGKSHLIPLLQEELLQAMNSHNLEVSVGVRGDMVPTYLGSSSAPWDDSFKDMVQVSDEEFVEPASISDDLCLIENGVIKGNVQMFLRLSCFGKSIQTQFEVVPDSGNKQFIFKAPNMATTFICSKYGAGTSTDFIPIGPLYHAGYTRNLGVGGTTSTQKPTSWTAVLEGRASSNLEKRSSLQSECLFPEYVNLKPPIRDSTITFDIASLRVRPEEEKFLDFLTGKKFGELTDSIYSFSVPDYVRSEIILKEDGIFTNRDKIYITARKPTKQCHVRSPLRLRGGGSEENNMQSDRLRAGALSKSPIAECKEIMEQFDKILIEYRKALSPCKQIACNYTPNITEDLCKKSCGLKPEMSTNTKGCGLPECQYAKYKSALMAMDADIEKQFIGPAILGTCGHPKCSYQTESILPPIHWDCPEPLPVGKCRNPNCPYASLEKKSQGRFTSVKGPCGSNRCPYAPPAPCSSPNCPFQNPPACVPLKQQVSNKTTTDTKAHLKSGDTSCARCPFVNPPQIVNMVFCDNPNCEALKAASAGDCGMRERLCASPNCPYKSIKNQCSNPNCPFSHGEPATACSNPNCPLALKKENSGSCTNPNCPFKKSSVQINTQSCSNPNCPYTNSSSGTISDINTSSLSSACSNPDCPFRSSSKDEPPKETCANPECPFNKPSVESCKNPDCPFLKSSSTGSKESCDNPECPYKKKSKTSSQESECECDNPTCPSKKDTCINPNCPFNLRGYDACNNPDCPHKKDALGRDLGFCATPSPSYNEYCGDKSCPYHDRKMNGREQTTIKVLEKDDRGRSIMKIGSTAILEPGPIEHVETDRTSYYDMAPCGIKTCKFMGGHLTCKDCGVGPDGKRRGPCPRTCPGDPICPLATARKIRRSMRRKGPIFRRTCAPKKKTKQDYGEMTYPGYKIGHRGCVMPYFFVPPRMGWLWNIHTPCMNLKPRRGWRPGAITKTVAKAIMKHKKAANQSNHEEKKVKKKKTDDDSEPELIRPKPTLEIKKREGIYHITMNPLKDPKTLQMNENPYIDCTPMQFKVAKNNILDPSCVCTDEGEFYKSDSSSDDELDIEVTTPAGIIHPDRPTQKKEAKVKQTQYSEKDIPPPEETDKKKVGDKGDAKTPTKGKEKDNKGKGRKTPKDKIDKDKVEKEKIEKEKLEKERLEKEKLEKEKMEKEKAAKEKNAKEDKTAKNKSRTGKK